MAKARESGVPPRRGGRDLPLSPGAGCSCCEYCELYGYGKWDGGDIDVRRCREG